MIGYPFRSWSRSLIGLSLGVFLGAVLLSFLCLLLGPLLEVILGVSALAVMIGVWMRWLLFRFRGW